MSIWSYNRKPTSPGEILKEEFLIPMNLTQRKLAEHVVVDLKVINRIVNGRSSITPLLAAKLAGALGTSPEFWLNAQMATDLWKIKITGKKLPKKIKAA